MQTFQLHLPHSPTGQACVIRGDTPFDGRLVSVIPQGYLEQGYSMVEDAEFKIQFPIRQEYLLPL
ncbi:hypothetical protein ES702_07486 [subsurface metagenome]